MNKMLLYVVIFFSKLAFSAEAPPEDEEISEEEFYLGYNGEDYPDYYFRSTNDNYDPNYYKFISMIINHNLKQLLLKDKFLFNSALIIYQNPDWDSHINGNWGTCILLDQFDKILKPHQKIFSYEYDEETVINTEVMTQLERQHLIREIAKVIDAICRRLSQEFLVSRLPKVTAKFPRAFSTWKIITCNKRGHSLTIEDIESLNIYFIGARAISPEYPIEDQDIGPIFCRGINAIIQNWQTLKQPER